MPRRTDISSRLQRRIIEWAVACRPNGSCTAPWMNGSMPRDCCRERACVRICISETVVRTSCSRGHRGAWSGSRFGYLRTRGALKPLFSQIDCAVITEHAVYILEVKSCYAHVAVDANGNVLSYAGTEDSVDRNKSPWNRNGDVRQCARHASASATRYPQIPFERIFEIVVYVDPFSMANERPWMVDNACVAALGCKGESFIEVIEDAERGL